ncbi:3-hydroxybutyrate dehydrogenase [Alphaproteobacteria bacterium LSUCC0684]
MPGYAVFVTGATSGIGLGIARKLASAGHHVAFNGLADASTVNAVKAELAGLGAESCHYFDGDMRDAGAIRAMMAEAEEVLGRIDGLVNNAGIQHVAPIETFPPEKWDEIIAVNLSASFHTIAAVLKGMKERNFGRIINISSVHGLIASVNKTAYIAAKHGLVGLTKAVALEAATSGVTCNAICPAWVRTPLVEAQIEARMAANGTTRDEEARAIVGERQPNERFVTVEEIGDLVRFLIEGEGAASITGTAMPIDGAWTAQ